MCGCLQGHGLGAVPAFLLPVLLPLFSISLYITIGLKAG